MSETPTKDPRPKRNTYLIPDKVTAIGMAKQGYASDEIAHAIGNMDAAQARALLRRHGVYMSPDRGKYRLLTHSVSRDVYDRLEIEADRVGMPVDRYLEDLLAKLSSEELNTLREMMEGRDD